MINEDQINSVQFNDFGVNKGTCQGITLYELRQRLRNELSGYVAGTLLSNDTTNDVERQFINDGISVLWPHDWETVMFAIPGTNRATRRFYLPDDCEHVLSASGATVDINNPTVTLAPIPHHDGWLFDRSFIDASTSNLLSGEPWVDSPKKTLQLRYPNCGNYLVVRYARKWQELTDDSDCIDPMPNRINAIIFYACAQYFISNLQVNTESIRYRNYQAIANSFMQLYQSNLIRDSKPLYLV
jgi:hypothetical protein